MEQKNVFLIKLERFPTGFSKTKHGKKMDPLNICDTLPINAMFLSRWTCGSPWPERKYALVDHGERTRWILKKMNINGRVIYVSGYNHNKEERLPLHTLHGNIHEVGVRRLSMRQCPHMRSAC